MSKVSDHYYNIYKRRFPKDKLSSFKDKKEDSSLDDNRCSRSMAMTDGLSSFPDSSVFGRRGDLRSQSTMPRDFQRLTILLAGICIGCVGSAMMQIEYLDDMDRDSNLPHQLDCGAPFLHTTRDMEAGMAPFTLPPLMTQEEVHRQAFHALDRIAELIQPVLGESISDADDSSSIDPDCFSHLLQPLESTTTLEDPRHQILYLITPTHKRVTQMVDLTRVSQTLQLAKLKYGLHLYWIIVEDAHGCTQRVRQILLDSGIPFAHTFVPTLKTAEGHKGVDQRNRALGLIRDLLQTRGVVYFLDDDNAYDVRIFPELLYTKNVSVGAVGLPSPSNYERCHVNEINGTVDRLLSGWSQQIRRPFGIDMAGFAFSASLLTNHFIRFSRQSEKGFLEHDFMKRLIDGRLEILEPFGGNCTRILTWHVRTSVGMPNRQYKSPEINGSGNGTLIMQLV